MINQELLDYIKQQTAAGKARAEIATALQSQGWQPQDIENGFNAISSGTSLPVNIVMPTSGQIFKESWAIYKNRFRTLIGINLIPVAAGFLLGLLAGIFGIYSKSLQPSLANLNFLIWMIIGLVVLLALIYLILWAGVAELIAIKDRDEGIGWKEAFKRSKPKIGPCFSTALIGGLAVLGGFILFIIPGIIFGLWYSQINYIVVEEGLSNTAALKQSKSYIKGRMGMVFGRLAYILVITIALYFIIALILGIIGTLANLSPDDYSWLMDILSLAWTPVIIIYGYQLYKHLKAPRN